MLALSVYSPQASAAVKGASVAGAMLPDRYLTCILGRSTNIDPGKPQTTADIISEGRHKFVLRLPPIPVHRGELPDPTDAPDPVDARTRVLLDADGLTTGVVLTFNRVVDLWPTRVEMLSAVVGSSWSRMIIIDPIDPAAGRAHLFMTRVRDAASMDLQHIYQGECTIADRLSTTAAR